MREKDGHHFSIRRWQNQRSHLTRLRINSSKSINGLSDDLLWSTRAYSCWCPTAHRSSNSAKTSLVLDHKDHWSMVILLSILYRFLNGCWKFFLKSSCASLSAFGCIDCGSNFRQLCRSKRR